MINSPETLLLLKKRYQLPLPKAYHHYKQRTSAEHIAQWFHTTEIQQLKWTTYISSEPMKVLIVTPCARQLSQQSFATFHLCSAEMDHTSASQIIIH